MIDVPRIVLPQLNTNSFSNEDRMRELTARIANKGERYRLGVNRTLDIDTVNSGRWVALPDESMAWALEIQSPGALALRIDLEALNLPAGAVFYIFPPGDPAHAESVTGHGLRNDGTHWSSLYMGDTVRMELLLPKGSAIPISTPLIIKALSHVYRDAVGLRFGNVGSSSACNLDISCYPDWHDTGQSVARIFFNDSQFMYLCSAVLVNNNQNDYSPLLLTAHHCIDTQALAATGLVDFNFTSISCNSTNYGGMNNTSVQSLLATTANGDMTLLQLVDTTEPGGLDFAGWILPDPAVGDAITGIHHPEGDLTKISFGNVQTQPPDPFFPGSHVVQWTAGITEPGSSGSPLLNSVHQVLGTLTGGSSSCSTPQGEDYYGKLSNAYPSFLDPNSNNYLAVGLPDGPFAPNFTRQTAATFPFDTLYSNLVAKYGRDNWYKFHAPANTVLRLWTGWTQASTSLVLGPKGTFALFKDNDSTPLQLLERVSVSVVNGAYFDYMNNDGADHDFYLQINDSDYLRYNYELNATIVYPSAPVWTNVYPSGVTFRYFMVYGSLNTNGWPVEYWMEYSTDPAFAKNVIASMHYQAPTYTTNWPPVNGIGIDVDGLDAGATYYARLVATNTSGTTISPVVTINMQPLSPPQLVDPGNGSLYSGTYFGGSYYEGPVDSCDVYLGTNQVPPLLFSQATCGTYNVPQSALIMAPNTTYYWMVVSHYKTFSAASQVWSFHTGIPTIYTVPAGPVDFGSVMPGQTGAWQSVKFLNNGTMDVTNFQISTAGDFEATPSNYCYPTFGLNGYCLMNVRFKPTSVGSRSGSLVFTSPGLLSTPFQVSLTGTGLDIIITTVRPTRQHPVGSGIVPGQSEELAFSAGLTGPGTNDIQLACTGAPAGVSCEVSPAILHIASGQQTVPATATVHVAPRRSRRLSSDNEDGSAGSANAPPPGDYHLKLTARVGSLVKTQDILVTVLQ